jgi:hypothetical protein
MVCCWNSIAERRCRQPDLVSFGMSTTCTVGAEALFRFAQVFDSDSCPGVASLGY